jgi:uncharacterized delta-60 repeat protein
MTLRRSIPVLVALLFFSRPQTVLAAPGDYDGTFAGVGFTRIDFGGGESRGLALALSGDGALIIAGDQTGDFAIARLLSNGSLDPAFSGDGRLVLPIGENDHARDVCLQSDGRIVIAGFTGLSHDETLVLVRLLADGSLDASFDGDGILTSRLGINDGGTALAIQPDGRIVVIGWSLDDFDAYRVRVSRYLASGVPDSGFGDDGHFFHERLKRSRSSPTAESWWPATGWSAARMSRP